jgi:hypothetical protein
MRLLILVLILIFRVIGTAANGVMRNGSTGRRVSLDKDAFLK